MRILELYLKAFGPFTERRVALETRSGAPGLFVIYGANEVGKSSALRAIRDFFYGIPPRSVDNFVHEHAKMRVGARLAFSDGEVFAGVRRKGTKDTLLAYPSDAAKSAGAEQPIGSERLDALVRATPRHVFDHFYGLDHEGLSRGSAELLDTEGELGQALFAAGLGTGNLRTVLQDLDTEARELFKATGKNPAINAALARWKALREEISKRSLKPSDVKRAERAERAIAARLSKLEGELADRQLELSRFQRIRLTLPALARHRLHATRFADMKGTLELPEDFEERLRTARLGSAHARVELDRTTRQITILETKRDELDLSPGVVEAREGIESLASGISAFQEAADQLPRREAAVVDLEARIGAVLRLIGRADAPGEIEMLTAPLARAARIRDLAERVVESEARLASLRTTFDKARTERDRAAEALETWQAPPDSSALRVALDRARKLGDVDDRLFAAGPAMDAARSEAERRLAALGRWRGSLEEIDRLAVPDDETLNRWVDRFESASRARAAIEEEKRRLELERREAEEQLARLRAEGEVPSRAERDALRAARDRTWRAIRRAFVDRGTRPGSAPESTAARRETLADRLEVETSSADRLADRLQDEASRVAQEAQGLARLERIDTALETLDQRAAESLAAEQRAQDGWQDLWSGLDVELGDPVAMRSWQARFRELRDGFVELRRDRRDWESQRALRDEARDALVEVLGALERSTRAERVDDAIRAAETLEEELEARRARGVRLHEDLEAAEAALTAADAAHAHGVDAIESITTELGEAIEGLRLGAAPKPREVHERLDQLTSLRSLHAEREDLTARIDGMRSKISRFREEVDRIVDRCAPDLKDMPPDAAAGRLRERLVRAAAQESKRVTIDESLETLREEHAAAQDALARSAAGLSALREEACVAADDDLDAAVGASRAFAEARRSLAAEEENLAGLGQGRSTAQLEAEAADCDPDAVPARIEALESEIAHLTAQKEEAQRESGAHAQLLAAMDGNDEVAALAEEEQALLAALGVDVRRYVTLTLAREILAGEIDRYREQNEAPVLGRATELFRALTRERYVEVQSEYDASDRPQLVVVQNDDRRKGMKELSSGTRDQLYLALRLATLEETIDRGEPMPFIADDILVEFDDERSRVALDVLADLARKTQILLFSHHAHIAEQARDLGSRACVVELS